jgi:hypothetical protein
MLIGGERVLGILESYRLCWIGGRFGGGKTSLAFRLAQPFLERGYRLLTNIRTVWADSPDDIDFVDEFGHLRLVVIMDEGGLWLKRNAQVEAMAAYAAKMDVFYIVSSYFPPASYFRIFKIKVLYGFRHIRIPVVFYRWSLRDVEGFADKGLLIWWNPGEVYGVYSRQDPAADGNEIVDFMAQKVEEFRSRYDRSRRRKARVSAREQASLEEVVADFADVVSEFRDAAARVRRR